MNKKGFVFVESIVVLVVVAFAVAILIASYGVISRKIKEKEHYDKASDKYLLYAISQLGSDDECNYSVSTTKCTGVDLSANSMTCGSTKIGKMMERCDETFKYLNIKNLYVVSNIRSEINSLNSKSNYYVGGQTSNPKKYTNGVIEYMKTLKKCNDSNWDETTKTYKNVNKDTDVCNNPVKYMIGEFERQGTYYYASIEL